MEYKPYNPNPKHKLNPNLKVFLKTDPELVGYLAGLEYIEHGIRTVVREGGVDPSDKQLEAQKSLAQSAAIREDHLRTSEQRSEQ